MASGFVDALNRVYRCTIKMRVRQQQIQTAFHVRDVLVPNTSAQDIHAEVKPWVFGLFRAQLSNAIALEAFEVENIDDRSFFTEPYISTNGSYGVPIASSMLAVTVALRSNLRSRHANGRMFWPFPGNPENDGAPDGTYFPMVAAATDLITRFGGVIVIGQAKLVVVGKPDPTAEAPNNTRLRWTDVEQVRVNRNVTALRSRKVGVGS